LIKSSEGRTATATTSAVLSIPLQKTRTLTTTLPAVSAPLLSPRQVQTTRTIQKPRMDTTPRVSQAVASALAQPQLQKSVVSSSLITSPAQTATATSISPAPPSKLSVPFIWLPSFTSTPQKTKQTFPSLKVGRSFQYFPSFKALAFNIRKIGREPSPTIKWTGLELRPIYQTKKRKRNEFELFPLRKK
jgi:hypothetical protein